MTARDRLVVIVVVALAILAGFWFLLIAPKRQTASDLQSQVSQQQDALATAQSNVTSSTQARNAYYHDYATVVSLGKAVPSDPETQSLLVELQAAAAGSKVDFREIDQGSSTVGPAPTPPAPAAANNAVTTANNASTAAGGSTTPTTATTPAAPVSAASTTDVAPGTSVGAGLTTIPFSLVFEGNYFHLARFIDAVQKFTTVGPNGQIHARGRLLVIGSIAYAAGPKGFPQIKATISATAYQLPQDTSTSAATVPGTTGNQAAAASTTPAATPAPAATATPVGAP